jgi:uncharacterized membrane protein YkoI
MKMTVTSAAFILGLITAAYANTVQNADVSQQSNQPQYFAEINTIERSVISQSIISDTETYQNIQTERLQPQDNIDNNGGLAGNYDGNVPTDVVSQALAILNGTVIYTDSDDDDYEIYIETSSGAVVEFYYEDNKLEEMEGEKGPFDYDFRVDGFISFAEALGIALNQVDGTLAEWDLDVDDDHYFEFDVNLNGKRYEVEIDAISGDVLEVDDDDDDDEDDD